MKLRYLIAAVLCAGLSLSCTPDSTYKTPGWDLGGGDDGGGEQGGGEQGGEVKEKSFFLWIDAAANFNDFANSEANIVRDLTLAADAGFTDVVVDVRPTSGNVLFKSKRGTELKWVGAWVGGNYIKVERSATFDYLETFIREGHKLGLKVHAAVNTMVGGNTSGLGKNGLLFDDPSKKGWASTHNKTSGLINAMDAGNETTKFLNPANAEVQEYLISLLKDLAAYKDLDGIFLDRCRYTGLDSDFSEDSRAQFAKYMGLSTIVNWPEDVIQKGADYNTVNAAGWKEPKYYKKWLEWRAKVIHDFIEKASNAVHSVNKDVKFGVYVGGWYSQYYDVGVNWASPDYASHNFFPKWANSEYHKYGYADHCDHMLIGAYASPGAVYGTGEWTMQGFCQLAKSKIGKACPVVAGGPDVGNWDSENRYGDTDYRNAVTNSVKACADACDGYFCFDMIHLKMYNYWPEVKEGIKRAKESEK
ncbi:MAG: family 10 glycosylhydrolase [Bacteroidales bacterium]|nr:family 10 glycosylhydrolase [Bacteroidales bacterium]